MFNCFKFFDIKRLFRHPARSPLPSVTTLEGIQAVLDEIKYNGDSLNETAEQAWSKKEASCIGLSALAYELLKQIGKRPAILSVKSKLPFDSHRVAVWMEPEGLWYFSNQNLRKTEFKTYEA
jgi:hypothetical protein